MRATNTTFMFTMATTVVLLLSVAFIFVGSGFDFDYIIPKRLAKLAAIFIGGSCVATAAITFQTLAGNRVLTPSIMGYESIYLVFQALLLLFLGTGGIAMLGVVGNFFASMILILLYSLAIQYWVLQKFQRDMYQVLLIGFVLTMVLTTLAQFIQLRISPGEFSVFQGLSYASFDRATLATLLCAAGTLAAIAIMAKKCIRELDVVGLGRDQAMSLGLNDANYIPKYFALIAILVAVSISLIGPTAFMGIFVANIAYSLAGTSQHRVTLPIGCAVAIIVFIGAQLIVEHLFNYKTTVTILVNILCGGYFLATTMRARSQL
ncbi:MULTISPECIES: iron chelate uptake ABC transporter family permease subunit [unclassified Moritella]|uniref:iron chelate uptake ABC transporter family permease subunit n=1 Tax=unclassified Moritella TaxID=2637987 RepID=UPI000796E91B|nr:MULTISPECIES: iron chelate uptake ABC transporter family permease subunit [unclassified Moritella]KXO11567.1 Iron compound ABC uptake transporter permease protein PiuC [Moritella sp. JT01]MCJ8351989.1 iron chelate uptake ABC transporter family permease subunit [Moritella sp.]